MSDQANLPYHVWAFDYVSARQKLHMAFQHSEYRTLSALAEALVAHGCVKEEDILNQANSLFQDGHMQNAMLTVLGGRWPEEYKRWFTQEDGVMKTVYPW